MYYYLKLPFDFIKSSLIVIVAVHGVLVINGVINVMPGSYYCTFRLTGRIYDWKTACACVQVEAVLYRLRVDIYDAHVI